VNAGEIMSTKVISVSPDTPGRAVARLLFTHGISAVPVVDKQGAPLGMVSEGDLMPRNEAEREARRDWWLQVLSEGEDINPEFVRYLRKDRTAGEIMIKPIITVSENAELTEVAELLSRNKIKRVPVLRDGRMVGIVSRADLVKAFAQPREAVPTPDRHDELPVAPVCPTLSLQPDFVSLPRISMRRKPKDERKPSSSQTKSTTTRRASCSRRI
jgi:CBS domain-containing protein